MSDLSAKEKRKLEVFFEMGGGYYSAFSNNTLEAFIADTLGLELYSEKYNQGSGSKANRIRAMWELEPNHIVGKLITETIEHDDDEHLTNPHMNKRDAELKSHCLKIAQRLVSDSSQKQPGFQPQQQSPGFQPQPQSSGFQPQPQSSVFQPQPQSSVFQPQPQSSVFQPQPQSSVFQPQQQSSGFQPQPQSSGFQPQPQSSGFQPQPQSSGFQPQPQSSGFQPQQQSSGFQPQPQSSGFQPQQQSSGFQPQQQISNQAFRKQTTKDTIIKNKVFIVHGHDDLAKEQIARFITQIGLVPIILHEQASSSKTIIEKIEKYAEQVCFAVVLYTPCDQGSKNGDSTQSPRARQNVVFEHGYFIGKLGRENVTAVVKGSLEKPNDISGVVYEIFDDNGAWKLKLAKEMKNSGCKIDMNHII